MSRGACGGDDRRPRSCPAAGDLLSVPEGPGVCPRLVSRSPADHGGLPAESSRSASSARRRGMDKTCVSAGRGRVPGERWRREPGPSHSRRGGGDDVVVCWVSPCRCAIQSDTFCLSPSGEISSSPSSRDHAVSGAQLGVEPAWRFAGSQRPERAAQQVRQRHAGISCDRRSVLAQESRTAMSRLRFCRTSQTWLAVYLSSVVFPLPGAPRTASTRGCGWSVNVPSGCLLPPGAVRSPALPAAPGAEDRLGST